MLVSVFILGVPYRGSLLILFFISSLFLLSTLALGLLISTITRNGSMPSGRRMLCSCC